MFNLALLPCLAYSCNKESVMLSTERLAGRDGPVCPHASCAPPASHASRPHLCLVPRAMRCFRLAEPTPRNSGPDSHCAQPRSDLHAVASSSVPVSSSASTSVHWGQQVDEHMLHPYVSCVSSGCCKSRSGVA
jgi:hypothetical protein